MALSGGLVRLSTDVGPAAANRVASGGLLALRWAAGVFLIVHAVQKLDGYAGFAATVRALGWPLPDVAAALTVLGEGGLGALLIIGAATRLAGALLVVLMAAIWLTVHASQGLVIAGKPGLNGETGLLFLVIGAVLATLGAGAFSADGKLHRARARRRPEIVAVEPEPARRRAA